jgi:hypothetical protein
MANCANHPASRAHVRCPACNKPLCGVCITTKLVRNVEIWNCAACGRECLPLPAEPGEGGEGRSFFAQLPGAFGYPFRGSGWLMLILGPIFFGIMSLASRAPLIGLAVTIVSAGYLSAMMLKIIRSSATGEQELPGWPEFSCWWEDILRPFFLVLGTILFCMLPAIVWFFMMLKGQAGAGPGGGLVFLGLVGLGLLYLPMGLTAVAIFNTAAALNPAVVGGSIFRIPLQYLAACGVLLVAVGARMGFAYAFASMPILGAVVNGLVAFYLLTVEMRVLGLLYHANSEKLDWF